MRVTPEGFTTSTRVVTSNTRQRSLAGDWANALETAPGNAAVAETAPERRRKSRRSMDSSWVGTARQEENDNKIKLQRCRHLRSPLPSPSGSVSKTFTT